ncbi:MAG: ABC transporter ATP-binding protein [Sulfurospirillaceae bacterium]|jgi:ABC-2 type transport system ATP-binding protein|nr:ABC transporter ATP-binding protein [Sulfurospirillaceae bacterium]MCK9545662.1 ABC transporter ATP-binding protein [Sulfurospirillaceae bacterium]MDY0237996.1 ABC transporter ATP-binding protein [Campylobacterales bacterium]NLN00132.1 ABC transporter ATP-binding protein [Campylobacteraceae bacterium]
MIEVKNLTKVFGSQKSLDDISLNMKAGDRVIVMGQNGAGKTTLVRAILGEYIPTKGEVSIEGYNPTKQRDVALANIGFVPQLPPPIKLSVQELIRYATISSGASKEKIIEVCEFMDLEIKSHMKKLFFKLSGGMKQKLLIAIALARDPKIFIFDEPTANLDPHGREKFYELLQKYKEDKLMIFISHRLEEIGDLVNKRVEMDLGKVVKDEYL